MLRVRLYVDGYNFYYAVKQSYHLDRVRAERESHIGLGWCDFRSLGQKMIDPRAEELHEVYYFSATVEREDSRHTGEIHRQLQWLSAANTIPCLKMVPGHFLSHRSAREPWPAQLVNDKTELKPKRKEQYTDTNIAVNLLLDGIGPDAYDKAILITGDTDLAPAVYAVQERMKTQGLTNRLVDVWHPPGASRKGWDAYFRETGSNSHINIRQIDEKMLASSLLPYSKPGIYECPPEWRLPEAYLSEHVPELLRPDLPSLGSPELTPSVRDDMERYQAGLARFLQKDYYAALAKLRSIAVRGHSRAQYLLGCLYEKGNGVPCDCSEAAKWYRTAAAQGDPDAQFALAEMILTGRGEPLDIVEAAKWYLLASRNGHPIANVRIDEVAYNAGPEYLHAAEDKCES